MRRFVLSLMLSFALLAGLAPAGTSLSPTPAAAAASANVRHVWIPGSDGTPISAVVAEPGGSGPYPLLLMPSSYALNALEYVIQAKSLASTGEYVVVSYTSRGFYESPGELDVAGPKTVADVSAVIDWAGASTAADTSRVGVAGISYGAGQALLAAAEDPRIRAVASMSGWSDIVDSLYPNETVSSQGVELLLAIGNLVGNPGPELQAMEAAYREGRISDVVDEFGSSRSPINGVDRLNANGTAVLMAQSYGDSLFPPSQFVELTEELTGPKKVLLGPGDHATAELPGVLGLPNGVWDTTRAWFDHHLKAVDNGIDRSPRITMTTSDTRRTLTAGSWDELARGTTTSYLTAPAPRWLGDVPTGGLQGQPATGWSSSIRAGVPTVADSGTVLVTGLLQGYLRAPKAVSIPLVSRSAAGVWTTPVQAKRTTIAGTPSVGLTVTTSAPDATLFAYLYEVGPVGLGSLVTFKPYSLRGVTPGVPQTVEFDLETVAWDIAAGNRLMLVVDTVDPRYQTASSRGQTVTFGSAADAPSYLEIPFTG